MRRWVCAVLGTVASVAFAPGAPIDLRIATYNASLNRGAVNQLQTDLSTPNNAQAKRVAEVVQRVKPDVLLINEFDYDAGGVSLQRFHDNYLAVSQNGQPALSYPHRFSPPVNTGVNPITVHGVGYDFDNASGIVTTPGSDPYGNDCFGFGVFPGQYGFAVYSKFPIDAANIRTFQKFLWQDLPSPVWPDNFSTPGVPGDWYSAAEKTVFRLSSKTHADVPIELKPGQWFHLLPSHPTPPAFDGSEDRNGRRNRDEIRFWSSYINNEGFIYDDATPARPGGLAESARFVILGDLNADPKDGDSYLSAINQLLHHQRVSAAHNPSSLGAVQDSTSEGGINNSHLGNSAYDTADFSGPGNLRVDHVLPSKAGFSVIGSGVFWPRTTDPGYFLIDASDHRLVWIDMRVEPVIETAVADLTVRKIGNNPNNLVLEWAGEEGVGYTVQRTDDLVGWTTLASPVSFDPVTKMVQVVDEDTGTQALWAYRVVVTLEQ